MLCPKCGTELPDNAKFCLSCGEKLTNYKKDEINHNESDINKKSTETKTNSESTSQNNAITKQHIFKSNTPPKKTHDGYFVLIAIFIIICIAIGSWSQIKTAAKQKEMAEQAEQYETVLTDLRNGDYKKAAKDSEPFSDENREGSDPSHNVKKTPKYSYKDGAIIDKIAKTLDYYYTYQNYSFADAEVKKIPDEYFSGEFGDKLTLIRDNASTQDKEKRNLEKQETEQALQNFNSNLHLDDPEKNIIKYIGKPIKISVIDYGNGSSFKQYIYPNGSKSKIEISALNGKISDFRILDN